MNIKELISPPGFLLTENTFIEEGIHKELHQEHRVTYYEKSEFYVNLCKYKLYSTNNGMYLDKILDFNKIRFDYSDTIKHIVLMTFSFKTKKRGVEFIRDYYPIIETVRYHNQYGLSRFMDEELFFMQDPVDLDEHNLSRLTVEHLKINGYPFSDKQLRKYLIKRMNYKIKLNS